ncbi:acyltransferase domain-containing protein [Streptomyces sp. NPDC059892]|uniref:acyltransferase domain-containing protein n=1 Tax=unclassified Streptomyces TaxID=2593676 RepID=UPI003631338B
MGCATPSDDGGAAEAAAPDAVPPVAPVAVVGAGRGGLGGPPPEGAGGRPLFAAAWAAIEDARIVPAELAVRRTGVFLEAGHFPADTAAHRELARFLGLRGPAVVVPGGSGSGAAPLAVRSLRAGRGDLALLGCAVPGEGAGVLVLCRLADALAEGRRVHAVLGEERGAPRADGAGAGDVAALLRAVTAPHRVESARRLAGSRLVLAPSPVRRRRLVALAGADEEQLARAVRAVAGRIERQGEDLPAVVAAGEGPHRLFAAASRADRLPALLRERLARGEGAVRRVPPALLLRFPDAGEAGTDPLGGRGLLADPVFRAALDECDRVVRRVTGSSVTRELAAGAGHPVLCRAGAPLLAPFAVRVALARTLESWGLRPRATRGRGVGEVAAAVVAGALPLSEGARLLAEPTGRRPARDAVAGALAHAAGTGPGPVAFWPAGQDAPAGLGAPRAVRQVRLAPCPLAALEDLAGRLWCDGFDIDWTVVAGRPRRAVPRVPVLVTVSGRTERARARNAARLAGHLTGADGAALLDAAYTAAHHRPHLEHRATVVADSAGEAVDALSALARDAPHPAVVSGAPDGSALAVLFAGAGARWRGAVRELYRDHPAFRAAFDEARTALDAHLPLPLAAVVFAPEGGVDARLAEEPEFAAALSFACERSLFRFWEAWGVRPGAVAGHAVGGLTAAHAAGVLGLDDAARLVVAGARLTARAGASPRDFLDAARDCAFAAPARTLICPATGARVGPGTRPGTGVRSPGYWLRHTLGPAAPADLAAALRAAGYHRSLECGPVGQSRALLSALGELHVAGEEIAWPEVFGGTGALAADLPPYTVPAPHPLQLTGSG